MNALKYALIFLAGAGVGFGASAIFFKKKYTEVLKKTDEELEKMDEYYKKKLENLYAPKEEEPVLKDEEGHKEDKDPDSIKRVEKPEKRQGSFGTDYTSYYYSGGDPAESEHPREEEKPIREPQPPKLIRAEMYGQDGYSERVLYYYTDDDTLIPEGGTYDDIVDTDEVADSLGNALIKYGFADANNLERDIFVRNFDRKTDYHIVKVVGSLSEDYGG